MILQDIFQKIATGIVAVGVAIGSFFGIAQVPQDLGATVPIVISGFSTSLAAGITSTADSMTLVSGETLDGSTLNGTYGFVISSGASDEEWVLASCVDTVCTSMTRGISSITGNTSVSALKHSHAKGASVKISDHPQLAIVSRIINGNESFPNSLTFNNLLTYATDAGDSPLTDDQIPSKGYVDATVTAGGANASTTTKGIVEEATDAELQAGTAAGGTGARLFAGGASFTETPTASKVCVANDSGVLADGWLGLTTAGDTLYSDGTDLQRLALGTSGYFYTAGASAPAWTQYANLSEANTVFGSTDISGAELEDLSDGGATTLHSHAMNWKVGTAVYNLSTANGTQTIAHGLGRVPQIVLINGIAGFGSTGMHFTYGAYDGTTQSCVWGEGTSAAFTDGQSTSYSINFTTSAGNSATGVVTVDATNITITWTKTGSPSGEASMQWSVQ